MAIRRFRRPSDKLRIAFGATAETADFPDPSAASKVELRLKIARPSSVLNLFFSDANFCQLAALGSSSFETSPPKIYRVVQKFWTLQF